jgi:hypothetical protein
MSETAARCAKWDGAGKALLCPTFGGHTKVTGGAGQLKGMVINGI